MTESGSDKGHLYAIYLMEAVRLVEDIRMGIYRLDAYWAKHKELYMEATDSVLVVDPVVQKDLQIVISDIARLYNLFSYEPASKKCPYSDVSKERTSYFRDLLGLVSLSAIGSRAARNSLEHFEERVDHEIFTQRNAGSNSAGILYACIFPNTRTLALVAGNRSRVRAFAFEEMRYFNFEAQLSLREVEEEIKALRIVLIKTLGESGYENTAAGSGLIYPGAPSGSLTPTNL